MQDAKTLALAATRALRENEAFKKLPFAKQYALDQSLSNLEASLQGDPYAMVLETPLDFQRGPVGGTSGRGRAGAEQPAAAPAQPKTRQRQATEVIGGRAADTLEAVDFPGFVAGLVTGTFQAIVDATIQQLHEYADLIANLSRSVDEFARENVTVGQARQRLIDRHPADLEIELPPPGEQGTPRLLPRAGSYGESPEWLTDYGLEDEELTEELTEGRLLEAGRRVAAQDRLQTLATMVLLGINRIVVNEGHIRAKMQFHAVARDRSAAEVANLGIAQQQGVAGRQTQAQSVAAKVSTVRANVQADAGIKADLMGEVRLEFATETFPLDRFADPNLLEIITRHARWRPDESRNGATLAPSADERDPEPFPETPLQPPPGDATEG